MSPSLLSAHGSFGPGKFHILFDVLANVFVDIAFGEFGSDPDSVLDRAVRRAAVADDADAVDADERRATVFRIVHPAFERTKRRPHQQIPELRNRAFLDVFPEEQPDGLRYGLGNLEYDISDETVANDDVGPSGHQIAPLDVSDEVERSFREELERLFGQFVALGLFLADGQEADFGIRVPEEVPRVDLAHDGELQKVIRLAVDVCA